MRRSCSRIEPLLYQSVTFSESSTLEKFLKTMDSKPAEFFVTSVKSIVITGMCTVNQEQMVRLLSVCTGVRGLWNVYKMPIPLSILSNLRLRKLHMILHSFMYQNYPPDYFSLPAFSELTHLEVHDQPNFWPTFQFGLLPSLTHLSIFTWDAEEYNNSGIRSLVSNALSECALLEVLILNVRHSEPRVGESHIQFRQRVTGNIDPRIVLVYGTKDMPEPTSWRERTEEHWRRADERVIEQKLASTLMASAGLPPLIVLLILLPQFCTDVNYSSAAL